MKGVRFFGIIMRSPSLYLSLRHLSSGIWFLTSLYADRTLDASGRLAVWVAFISEGSAWFSEKNITSCVWCERPHAKLMCLKLVKLLPFLSFSLPCASMCNQQICRASVPYALSIRSNDSTTWHFTIKARSSWINHSWWIGQITPSLPVWLAMASNLSER